jgi:nitrogenase molybdenum-iron protein alpha/beta subunit
MTVQTIPPIDEMTPAQQIELMEALWKSMGENQRNIEPPDWHREYLEEREKAIVAGTDEFIDIDKFEADLRRTPR